MIEAISSCSLLIAVGAFKKVYKLTLLLISFILLTNLIKLIHNDIIYNTLLVIVISLFARYINNKVIKLALLILALYYLIAFGLSVNHIRDYSDPSWELVMSWSHLYVYVYYATISLIFIGLIIGGKGGRRIGSTGSNMFHSDYRSINYQRIRSKFN
jgi:hypothetical protein